MKEKLDRDLLLPVLDLLIPFLLHMNYDLRWLMLCQFIDSNKHCFIPFMHDCNRRSG